MTKAIICVWDERNEINSVVAMYNGETRHRALVNVLATITTQPCGKALSLAGTIWFLNALKKYYQVERRKDRNAAVAHGPNTVKSRDESE